MKELLSVCGVIRGRLALRPMLVVALAATLALLTLAGGVAGATNKRAQQCETPVFQNGLELVFGRTKTRAAADRLTAAVIRVGFKQAVTVQESCNVWKAVLRGLDSFQIAVAVQSEARRGRLSPTVECVTADQIGQVQAVFATRATLGDLDDVIQRARSFGYVGLKTKRAPCGGYQAYVAGFSDRAQADDFAQTARQRTGLPVSVIVA
jgi:hypothetical protein